MAEVLSFDDKTLINNKAKVKQHKLECHAFTNALNVVRNFASLMTTKMTKDTVTSQRILYSLLLVAFDVVGVIVIGIVFLGASNANGEGAPIESAFVGFLRQLAYGLIVSLFFSSVALLLTRLFHKSLSRSSRVIKNIFWVHLGGMLAIFLLSYLYLWLKFT